MSETSPTPSEKTVVVNNNPTCRLRALVFLSLGLNGLILAILLVGFLGHHHHGPPRFADDGDRGGSFCMMGERGFGHHFHGFGGHQFGMGPGPGGCPVMGPMGMMQGGNGPGMGPMGMMQGGNGPGMGPMGMMQGGNGPGMGMDMGKSGPPSPAEMTDKILNDLSLQLSLSEDQKTKLRPVIEQQVTQMQKDMEAQRQAMQKLMEDTKAKVKPILNADQQKQLDQIKLPGQNPPGPMSGGEHP